MVVLIHLICYLLDGLCCVIGKVQVPHLLGRNGHDGKGLLVLLVGRQPHLVHHGLVTLLVDGDGRGMHPGTRRDMMKSHKRIPAEVVVCVCLNKSFQFNCYVLSTFMCLPPSRINTSSIPFLLVPLPPPSLPHFPPSPPFISLPTHSGTIWSVRWTVVESSSKIVMIGSCTSLSVRRW